MNEKKPYTSPKIFRVELNQEQAILAMCSNSTTNLSNVTGSSCKAACRRSTTGSGKDSANNPS